MDNVRFLLHVRRLEIESGQHIGENRRVCVFLTANNFQSPDKLYKASLRNASSFEERDRMTTQTMFVRKNWTQDNAEDGEFPETTLAKTRFRNRGSYSSSRNSCLS